MNIYRHRSFKLRWSKYYQFIIEGQIFYFKLKAYTNKYEGMKEWGMITEQTYKRAIKKGYKDNVVVVEEEISIVDIQPLTLIFNKIYNIDEIDMRNSLIEAQESIRELRSHAEINSELEYRIFRIITELQIKEVRERLAV